MKYLIDSNIFIYAAAGEKQAIRVLDQVNIGDWNGYSAITRLEVLGYSRFAEDEEKKLLDMLACFNEYDVSSSIITEAIILRKIAAIRVPDAIIAATARIHGATLVTRNADDFNGISGLGILNPFA